MFFDLNELFGFHEYPVYKSIFTSKQTKQEDKPQTKEKVMDFQYSPVAVSEDTDNGVAFYVELPGASADDVEVTLQDSVIEIKAVGKYGKQSTTFRKRLVVPSGYSLDNLKPSMESGVLTINITKTPPKKLTVKGSP